MIESKIGERKREKAFLYSVGKCDLRHHRRSISMTSKNDSMTRINGNDESLFQGGNAVLFAL
jgi:hypothetical protein